MKKTMLLTLAAGLVCTTPAMALDLYIAGSTAFRANVHDACKNLFDSTPVDGSTLRYGSGTHNNGNAQWTMTGTVAGKISALGATPLTIHANFNGSVQGIQLVENMANPSGRIQFLDTAGNFITNSVTIGFTDCASGSTTFPATGNFSEEQVAVQPFVMCRSLANTNVDNVTWEQLRYATQQGRIPLSAFTTKPADHGTYIYLLERTKDSGTRRTQFAGVQFGFNQSAVVYNWDNTNNVFYKATNLLWATSGGVSNGIASYGVVGGSPGYNGANLNWGQGYIGGGDMRDQGLKPANPANQSLGYLSFADAKSLGASNWAQVISFNGLWPTAAGIGVRGNTGTNDFSPVTSGLYPNWGYEVVVYPIVDPSSLDGTGQNLTAAQLGNQSTPGTILGVLDAVTVGTPVAGSLDEQIQNSKVTGATAIRIGDMLSSRASVGGTITP